MYCRSTRLSFSSNASGMGMRVAGISAYQSPMSFWKEKIERNVARDVRNEAELKALGWHIIRVWECEIKTVAQREEYLKHLYDRIVNSAQSYLIETDIDNPSIAAEPESEQSYGNNNHS